MGGAEKFLKRHSPLTSWPSPRSYTVEDRGTGEYTRRIAEFSMRVSQNFRPLAGLSPCRRHVPQTGGPDVPPTPPPSEDRPSTNSHLGAGVCLGLSVLGVAAGLAAPAQAHVQVKPKPREEEPTSLRDSLTRPEYRFTYSHANDSVPGFLEPIVPANDRVPGQTRADDDGWTAELRLEAVRTEGDQQWVVASRYSMLTQRGAWEPKAPDYASLRTDLLEIGVQRNWKESLGPRTDLVYGLGGGVQSLGPLGGHWVQQSFHIHGGFGGRLDPQLQHNYSTSSATIYPVVTAGAGVYHRLNDEWTARGTAATTVPLGPGFSTARLETGLEYRPWSRVTFEGGVNVSGVYSNHRALDFMDVNGVRPGAYLGAGYRVTRGLNAFARVETNGVRSEPVYLIGFTIGGGPRPWLNPLW